MIIISASVQDCVSRPKVEETGTRWHKK